MENEYFKRKEFACKDGCGFDTVDTELLEVLTDVREYFDKPVTITSGNRCLTHNKRVGGSAKSKHMLGLAADIRVKDTNPREVYEYLCVMYPNTYGIGDSNIFTHLDVRDTPARWTY